MQTPLGAILPNRILPICIARRRLVPIVMPPLAHHHVGLVHTLIVLLVLLVVVIAPVSVRAANEVLDFYAYGSGPMRGRDEMPLFFTTAPLRLNTTSNVTVTWPAGSMLVMGGTAYITPMQPQNDVWVSSDRGATWTWIAGNAFMQGTAPTPILPRSTSFPGSNLNCYTQDRTTGILYAISEASNMSRSTDQGATWTTTPSSFVGHSRTACTVMPNGDVIFAGGRQLSLNVNDVYRSTDRGVTWTTMTLTAPWPPRAFHAIQSYRNTILNVDLLYVLGGEFGGDLLNDVWCSSDAGLTWSIVSYGPFFGTHLHSLFIAPNGVMLLVAGHTLYDGVGRTWASVDGGVSWGLCAPIPRFSSVTLPGSLSPDGFLFVNSASGSNQTYFAMRSSISDPATVAQLCGLRLPPYGPQLPCWPPNNFTCAAAQGDLGTDRLRFTLQTAAAPWSARAFNALHSVPVPITFFNSSNTPQTAPAGSLVLFGPAESVALNDVWLSTTNGVTWALISGGSSPNTSWPNVQYQSANAAAPNSTKLYVIGGMDSSSNGMQTVYRSLDGGVTWQETNASSTSPLPACSNPGAAVSRNGTIVVQGCLASTGPTSNHVSFDDGVTWTLTNGATPAASNDPFDPLGLAFVPARFGRSSSGGAPSDVLIKMLQKGSVWASSDLGTTWSLVHNTFPLRIMERGPIAVTKDGLIIRSGGIHPLSFRHLIDVVVSADGGVTWVQCAVAGPRSGRTGQAMALDTNGFLYMVGGRQLQSATDVWRSEFSFFNLTAVRSRCQGLRVPACGMGMQCWPPSLSCNNPCVNDAPTALSWQLANPLLDITQRENAVIAPLLVNTQYVSVASPSSPQVVNVVATRQTLVLFGGGDSGSGVAYNDVWISLDEGRTWDLVAGTAGSRVAHSTSTSFPTPTGGYVGAYSPRNGTLYMFTSDARLYRSVDGGVHWSNVVVTGLDMWTYDDNPRLAVAPGGTMILIGSQRVFASMDSGSTWRVQTLQAPWPKRVDYSLVATRSLTLRRSIVTVVGGRTNYLLDGDNSATEVWTSSDLGQTWAFATMSNPLGRSLGSLISTSQGLLIRSMGKGFGLTNDVALSADGGRTWSLCAAVTPAAPRMSASIGVSGAGNLVLFGGLTVNTSLWISTRNINDMCDVARACSNAAVPVGGIGLPCWPPNSAQCAEQYNDAVPTASEARCQPTSAIFDGDPLEPESSTGPNVSPDSKSGLSSGAIAGIIIGVIAGVAFIVGVIWYVKGAKANGKAKASSGTANTLSPSSPPQQPRGGSESHPTVLTPRQIEVV